MKTLIETFFELLFAIVKGIFDLVSFLFDSNTNEKLYDHSQMKSSDRRKIFSRFNKGIVVNGIKRITVKQSITHTLIVGKSGIGKTSSVYQVNLLKAKNQSFIITDLDGSMYQTCSGHLASLGYHIQVLNFEDVTQSAFFCPIYFCNTVDELKALAEQIVFSSNATKGNSDQFWNYSATHLLFFLLKLVKTQALVYQNLSNVRHLLNQMETKGFKVFVSQNTEGTLFDDYVSFLSKDVKLRTNIQASLSATLDLFTYSDVAHITSKNTIDFEKLTQPKSALFIIVPERLLRRNSLILSVFYGTLFDFVQKNKPKKPLYFLLDEAGNYFLKDLNILCSVLRRYNCSLNLGLQDISQLKKLYGNDASSTILSNTSTKIIFPGGSLELANQISKIAGQKSVEVLFEGEIRQQIKPVLTPTEIIQMKKNSALFLVSNYPPIILHMKPYFKQFQLKRRSKLKPAEFQVSSFVTPLLIPFTANDYDE